jgi:hypothetical protein
MQDEGRIAPEMDIPTLAGLLSVIGDGLFWRGVVDPAFDGRNLVPATVQVLAGLLKPISHPPASQTEPQSKTAASPSREG